MVTKKVIQTLYKQFSKPPQSADELNIALLFDYALENHGIVIDEDNLYIGSIDQASPFATLRLDRINEIVEFENCIAIVLPSSIVFLNKDNSDVNIHLRLDEDTPSFWNRLKGVFIKNDSDE
ncbi:MAG: hypothetical protein NC339_00820 [Muribaculaceae bacterium]|nr:hypothetical protein [Muribaculaceae bacterium]